MRIFVVGVHHAFKNGEKTKDCRISYLLFQSPDLLTALASLSDNVDFLIEDVRKRKALDEKFQVKIFSIELYESISRKGLHSDASKFNKFLAILCFEKKKAENFIMIEFSSHSETAGEIFFKKKIEKAKKEMKGRGLEFNFIEYLGMVFTTKEFPQHSHFVDGD